MSLHDHVERLIANLRESGTVLARARESLAQRRAAWQSPSPKSLAESAGDVRELADRSEELENERQAILHALSADLPGQSARGLALPGREPHLTVTRIAARLPASLGDRLRRTAAETARAARGARLETMLGKRLLEYSRAAQEGVFGDLLRLQAGGAARGYDRGARSAGAAPTGAGKLIDGRV